MPLTDETLKDKKDLLKRKRKREEETDNTHSSDGSASEPQETTSSSDSSDESEFDKKTRSGRRVKPRQDQSDFVFFSPQREKTFDLVAYRFSSSPNVRVSTEQRSGSLSKELRTSESFLSPSKITVLASNDHSSPITILTPSGKRYQRILECHVVIKSSVDSTSLRFFQEARPIKPSARKTQRIPEDVAIPRPSESQEIVRGVLISPGAIDRNKKRSRTDPRKEFGGLNAQTIAFIFDPSSVNIPQEYSHTRAHRHGGDDVVVASQHHNSLRIAAIECCGTKIILQGEPLYYSDLVEYEQDEHGFTPVIKKEMASWENEKGDRIEMIFDPKLSTKPSAQLFSLIDKIYQLVFNASEVGHDEDSDSQHVVSHKTLFKI